MATVNIVKPRIVTMEFHQEKTDEDYGSCLWARFIFDLDNYDLHITSDCGEYAYGWVPTPEHESFMKLMSRVNEDYILSKISSKTVIDGDTTWKNVKEYIDDILNGEEPDFDFEDVKNVCYYSSECEVHSGLIDSLKYTNVDVDNGYDDYSLWECIEKIYPYNAQKIVKVFKQFIQPKIKELIEEKGDRYDDL